MSPTLDGGADEVVPLTSLMHGRRGMRLAGLVGVLVVTVPSMVASIVASIVVSLGGALVGAGCSAATSDVLSAPDGGTDAASAPDGPGLGNPILLPNRDGGAQDATTVVAGDGGRVSVLPTKPMQPDSIGLHVSGAQILDDGGKAIGLYGVNRSGTEYACVQGFGIFDGPSDAASVAAIKSWNVNAVRVPLNEDCWLGINGVASTYGGTAYQTAIVDYVNLLLAAGVYPILDLHWTAPGATLATGQQPMPDSDHSVTFWSSVAGVFRGNRNVVLELFNEPWPDNNNDSDAAWTCWQSGGNCPSISYPVAGMQSLVTAVRDAGAKNLLLLGGVQYSNALSQWVAHKPADPLGNLAAAWHVYLANPCSDATCWDQTAGLVVQSFPIVSTEIGDDQCNGDFPTSVMTWLDAHHQSYLAWAWDAYGASCTNYSLITDYSGTPNGVYGAAFQTHLLARAP